LPRLRRSVVYQLIFTPRVVTLGCDDGRGSAAFGGSV